MKKILTILLLILCISCKESAHNNTTTVQLSRETLPVAIKLNAEQVTLPEQYVGMTYVYTYQDSILIMCWTKRNNDEKLITFYNLNKNEEIGSYLNRGNGPGEVLSAMCSSNNNNLLIKDYTRNRLAVINISEMLESPQTYKHEIYDYVYDAKGVNKLKDGRIILFNSYYFENEKYSNGAKMFITVDKNDKQKEFGPYKFFPHNVTGGQIIVNYKRNRFVCAFENEAIFNIYDSTLTCIKSVVGPEKFEPEYKEKEEGHISFANKKCYSAYYSYNCDDDFIYIIYSNINGIVRTHSDEYRRHPQEIFKFDWDGNLLKRYSLPVYIFALSASNNEDCFYGTGYDENEDYCLYKFTAI